MDWIVPIGTTRNAESCAMSIGGEWLNACTRLGPDVPSSLQEFIPRSDEILCKKNCREMIPEELETVNAAMSRELFRYLRVTLESRRALLQRQLNLVAALESNRPMGYCLELFRALGEVGFASPVEKARIIVVVLQYLEDKVPSNELQAIVSAMSVELDVCRTGSTENLEVLATFGKR